MVRQGYEELNQLAKAELLELLTTQVHLPSDDDEQVSPFMVTGVSTALSVVINVTHVSAGSVAISIKTAVAAAIRRKTAASEVVWRERDAFRIDREYRRCVAGPPISHLLR